MRWLWLGMLLLLLGGTAPAAGLHDGSEPYACTTDCWSGSRPQATDGPSGWIDPPPNVGAFPDPLLLAEAILAGNPFAPEARNQMDWGFPADFCATWENVGLTWLYLDDHEAWGAYVKQPCFRFYGIPDHYPDKPELEYAATSSS